MSESDHPNYAVSVVVAGGELFIDSKLKFEGYNACKACIHIPPHLVEKFLKDIDNARSNLRY